MKLFGVAVRNLKRNKKRTFLTLVIIVVAIMGMTFGLSWIEGEKELFLESGKRMTGDVRITTTDYDLRSRSLDVSSNINYSKVKMSAEKLPQDTARVGRIKFGGLLYLGDESEKAHGTGIEGGDERIIGLDKFVYKGRFLEADDEILVGETLKRKLNLKVGDEVSVLTQTQDKSLYSLNYRVSGFYKMDNTKLNKSFYITLASAQYLLDMEDRVTEYLIYTDKNNEDGIKNIMEGELGDEYLVKRWDEIGMNENFSRVLPVIQGIFILIFSTLAGVSISNTMLMMVFERRHEIGVLKALGMKEGEIRRLFLLEGMIMGVSGAGLGVAAGGTIALYLGRVGVNFGDMLEAFTSELNIKGIIYPRLTFYITGLSLLVGLITSILATYLAVSPEVEKEAAHNMRSE